VKKFFDSVDQKILLKIISFRIKDTASLNLLKEVICSFTTIKGEKTGMPIGNLTSQIFANIYLNEFDRYVKHQLKPKVYLRYGDDFILLETDLEKLKIFRNSSIGFLGDHLHLRVNPKSDKILKPNHGLKFLGVKIWSNGRTLNKRNLSRINQRLSLRNISGYSGIIRQHCNKKRLKELSWSLQEMVDSLQ